MEAAHSSKQIAQRSSAMGGEKPRIAILSKLKRGGQLGGQARSTALIRGLEATVRELRGIISEVNAFMVLKAWHSKIYRPVPDTIANKRAPAEVKRSEEENSMKARIRKRTRVLLCHRTKRNK